MLHMSRKNPIDNTSTHILEKRMKKIENDYQHLNVEVKRLKKALFFLTSGGSNNGGLGNGGLPGLGGSDSLPGLGDINLPGFGGSGGMLPDLTKSKEELNTSGLRTNINL